jgi:hypothetical protein
MKISTEIDNNLGYEKITQLVDNIPLNTYTTIICNSSMFTHCSHCLLFIDVCYNVVYSFSKSTKYVFCVQGAWHSPNTLLTMVHGQAFRIITRLPSPIERAPLSANRRLTEQLCRYEPCEPSPVHSSVSVIFMTRTILQ